MNIYVGNVSYSSTEEDLGSLFGEYGTVSSVKIIINKHTGRSKGFGFVEMPNALDANEAIKVLDSSPLQGRNIKVKKAKGRRKPSARDKVQA